MRHSTSGVDAALRRPTGRREHQVERRSPCERWQLGLLLAFMLSVSLTACGTDRSRSGQAPTRTSQTSNGTLRPAPDGHLSHVLSANFVLLRTPPDGVPPKVRRALSDPVPGMSWSLARRVPVSETSTYWLVPGAKDLCVVATTPMSPAIGTVCTSVNQALRHGIANTSLDPISGRRIIVGVVPEGTRTVLVRSGTSTASVQARHGHFVLRDSVSLPPDQLILR